MVSGSKLDGVTVVLNGHQICDCCCCYVWNGPVMKVALNQWIIPKKFTYVLHGSIPRMSSTLNWIKTSSYVIIVPATLSKRLLLIKNNFLPVKPILALVISSLKRLSSSDQCSLLIFRRARRGRLAWSWISAAQSEMRMVREIRKMSENQK